MITIVQADARSTGLEDQSVQCVVTSPPFWGLRQYGDNLAEIGRGTLAQYLFDLRAVGHEMGRVLKDDGVFWLNLGDTASGSGGAGGDYNAGGSKQGMPKYRQGKTGIPVGQWCLVPQRAAIMLQEEGWLLRQWITWDKGTTRPEDPAHTRRPGMSSEIILMLTKSMNYKFYPEKLDEKGNVWHFPPVRGKRTHYAPFPEELPTRCILPSTDEGDTVLDPFCGGGATLRAAHEYHRNAIGVDLYAEQMGVQCRP
jgi:DNA modification methylase